jgi:hypothetical protein
MVVDIDDTSGAPKNGGIDAELRYTGQFQSDQAVLCDDRRSHRFWARGGMFVVFMCGLGKRWVVLAIHDWHPKEKLNESTYRLVVEVVAVRMMRDFCIAEWKSHL